MIKRILSPVLALAMLMPTIPYAAASVVKEIYVSADSSDDGNGSKEKPFDSLERAKEEAAKYKDCAVKIILRGGNYYIEDSVVFDGDDSRTEENPLTVAAADGESVSLIGGKQIDAEKFSVVTDTETLNKIPVSARGKVYSLDLKEQGGVDTWNFKQFGTYYTTTVSEMPDLYVNDEKMTCARWPNDGYAKIGEVLDPGIGNGSTSTATGSHGMEFKCDYDGLARWKNAPDAMCYGYWKWNWSTSNVRIKGIDVENGTIKTVDSGTYPATLGQRFMVYNLLEELDAPGEWYIDQEKETLYFYPVCELENTKMMISQLDESIIKVEKCKNITFKGLNIEYGKYDLITIENTAENISFRGCNIRGSSGYGMVIKGINNGVIHSNIYDCASEGVLIQGGTCDNNEYTLSKNYVINCDIHDCGQRITTAAGIRDQANGAIMTHNKIHEIPAWGIGWGGFETQIEYNEIYNVLQETEDAGAIYGGRSSRARGSSVSYNYIHDVYGQDDLRSGAYIGIYLDDYLCAVKVSNNILKNVSTAIYGHHSAQCVVENNIIINKTAQSNGWVLWTQGGGEKSTYSFVTSHTNIDWTKEPYASKFPEAQNMNLDNIMKAFDNVIRNNLIVNHQGANIVASVYEQGNISDNYETDDDPGFVDMENDDYTLRDDSVVFEKMPDFKNIDMSKIGLYEDEERPDYTEFESFDPFTLALPKDNETNISGDKAEFSWNICPKLHIEKYRLIIAKDEGLTDVAADYLTRDIEATVQDLEANTRYYWCVEAIAKDGTVYRNADGVRSFTTSYYKIPKNDKETQYKDLSDFFADSENWKKGSLEAVSVGTDRVKFKGAGVAGYEGEYTDYNTLYHFGAIFDGGSWKAVAVHADNTEQVGWVHNAHYLVIIKPDLVELHKYPDSFRGSQMITSVPRTTSFEDKAVHDIVFGTYVKEEENYMVFAMDGDVIFNMKDTYSGVKKAPGYFAIYNMSGGEFTLTKPSGEIPEISFKNRELPSQYEKALDCSVLMKAGEARAYVDEEETQINKKNSKIVPIVREDRTLIPLRFAAECIGAEVSWNEEERSVVIEKDGTKMKLTIGENECTVNGVSNQLETAPIIEQNTTYVPARFIMETFGMNVRYDENTKLILIYRPENEALISDEEEWWNVLDEYVLYAGVDNDVFNHDAWDNGGKLADR